MAVAWTVISAVEQLQTYLLADQLEAINTAALGDSQNDRFTAVATDVINRVRNKVASCLDNRLSATPNSVPPECVWIACYLIIEAMQVNFPALRLSEDQVRQIEKAEKDLAAFAACDLKVSEPVDPLEPSPVQSGGAIRVVSSSTRLATREKMNGL